MRLGMKCNRNAENYQMKLHHKYQSKIKWIKFTKKTKRKKNLKRESKQRDGRNEIKMRSVCEFNFHPGI